MTRRSHPTGSSHSRVESRRSERKAERVQARSDRRLSQRQQTQLRRQTERNRYLNAFRRAGSAFRTWWLKLIGLLTLVVRPIDGKAQPRHSIRRAKNADFTGHTPSCESGLFRGNRETQSQRTSVQPAASYRRTRRDLREFLCHTFTVAPRWTNDSRRFLQRSWNTSDIALMNERLEDRCLLFAPLEIAEIEIGAWTRIDTPTVDERSIEAVQGENLLFYHDAAQPATPLFGSASHMWRQDAPSGPFGDKTAVEIKWFVFPTQNAGQGYNGRPVTIKSTDYSDIDGQVYLKWVGTERYQLFGSYDGTPNVYPSDGTFSNPVTTAATGDSNGYLGNGKFKLYDGHGPISTGSLDALNRAAYT